MSLTSAKIKENMASLKEEVGDKTLVPIFYGESVGTCWFRTVFRLGVEACATACSKVRSSGLACSMNADRYLPRTTGTSSYDGRGSQGNFAIENLIDRAFEMLESESQPVENDDTTVRNSEMDPLDGRNFADQTYFTRHNMDARHDGGLHGPESIGGRIAAEDINFNGDVTGLVDPTEPSQSSLNRNPYLFLNPVLPVMNPLVSFEPHPVTPPQYAPLEPSLEPEVPAEQPPTAFISYIYSQNSWPSILQLSTKLLQRGIKAELDAFEGRVIAMSRTDWYNKSIEESDFVIVCVDKTYKLKVLYSHPLEVENDEDLSLVGATYVFNQIQTKYMNSGCMNFNVLPLLIGDALFSDLPLWMQNTAVYRWPRDEDKLITRMLRP